MKKEIVTVRASLPPPNPDHLIVRCVQQFISSYKKEALSTQEASKLNKLGEVLDSWKEAESGLVVKTKKLQYSSRGETVMDAQVELDIPGKGQFLPNLIFRARSQKISEEALDLALTKQRLVRSDEVLKGFEAGTSDFRFTSKELFAKTKLEFALEGRKQRKGKKGVASSYPLDHVQIKFEWKQGSEEVRTKGFIMNEDKNVRPAKSATELNGILSIVDFAFMRRRIINLARDSINGPIE